MKRYSVQLVLLVLTVSCTAVIRMFMPPKLASLTCPLVGTPTTPWTLGGASDTETFTSTVALQQGQGQVYYVATNGDDGNPGTEARPFHTITKGISVLGPGDTLYVKSGTYRESLYDFPSGTSWDAPVTIAAYPGDLVVVKPSSGGFVAKFTHCHYVILDGFALDGINVDHEVIKITSEAHHIRVQNTEVEGAPQSGILVTTDGSVNSDYNELVHLDVHDNGVAGSGHGIYLETSNNLVDHCAIHHNLGWGVHIYNGHYPSRSADNNVVSNNIVHDNTRPDNRPKGIILSSGSGNMAYNNLVWGNDYGIQVTNEASDAKVYNNVVYANNNYGIRIRPGCINSIIRNNIVYQNGGTAISDAGSGTIQDHNLVEIDPRFVDASAHDFHLQPTSPAIDAGITLSEVPDDFDGVSRPRGGGYDIGAFEYPFSARVTDLRVVAAVDITPNLTVTLRWTAPVAAVTYTLRSSNTLLTAANWSRASIVTVPFTASEPGSSEWLTTPVDYTGGTLYLALKSQNSAGVWSGLSNNAFWPYLNIYLPLITKDYVASSKF